MKKYRIVDDGKIYYFTLAELSKNITKEFAKKFLSKNEFIDFCKLQETYFKELENDMITKSSAMHLSEDY